MRGLIIAVGVVGVVIAGVLGIFALGERVQVPPAYVGKILTASGFNDKLIPPSTFRLDSCLSLCDTLVLVEASDYPYEESLKLFMPRDQLNLDIDVRGVFAIGTDNDTINRVFDRIPARGAKNGSEHTRVIDMKTVYEVYGMQIVREVVRSELATYSIKEIMGSRDALSQKLLSAVAKRLHDTPLKVMQLGLANIQPPEVIVQAQEAAKQREIDIQKAESDRLIKLTEADAAIELAEKDQLIRLKTADTIRLENERVAASITDQYLAYRYLEVMEAAAKSGSTIFFPAEFRDSIGLQTRIFGTAPITKKTGDANKAAPTEQKKDAAQ